MVETKDPEGNIWKREYDAKGNISKEINPLGHITQYKYNNDNQLIEVIDAKGGSKKIQYNELGQMTSYTDCSGKSSTWEYDEEGSLTTEQTANNKVVQYLYSTQSRDKGQLQSIVYPDGLKEHFEHDEEGRLLKHIDTKGLVTEYQYNATGLLEQRIDANRHRIGYQWDKQGRIKKLINQNQAEYLFDYNQYGYLVREQAFDGEEKHYSYHDESGRLSEIRQPNILTQFDYYADGQIASKSFSHLNTGKKQTEQFDYNLNNQLSRASNEVSQIDFYRNALGQLVREHQHYKIAGLRPLSAVLRYEYDELGNLIKTIRPDGQEQANLSYGSGHLYAIALNKQDVVSFQRDDLHRETTRLLANGLIQTKHYNDVGLLSSQLIQPEQETQDYLQYQAHRHYHYDQNYLLNQVEDSRLGRLNYQYDPIGRLITTQSAHKTESFSFDPAGNLIDPVSASGTAQIKNNLVRSYQGKHYHYDAQGNVIETKQAGKTLKLTWDNQNRLIRSDHNGQVTDYGYDVFGRRLYKKTVDALTLFGWDGDLMIWESRKSEQDSFTKHYLYEPNSFVPLLQAGYKDFIQLIETPDYAEYQNKPYSVYKDPVWRNDTRKNRVDLEQITFYHCDQVGTPQTMTNARGECVWEITQDTWGSTLDLKTVNSDNPFEQSNLRFQGQYYDQETGLHYNRYRYYEPHSARYMSKDPIGLNGGMNTSAYVSDPTQWVDPMGLSSQKPIKTNEWITRDEKEALGKITNNAQQNIGSAVLASAAIQKGVSNAYHQAKDGAEVLYQNTSKAVNWAIPQVKEGSQILYNDIKTAGSNAYEYAKQIGQQGKEKVNQTVDTSEKLMVMACQMHHGCKLPDYLYCSHSGGRRGAGVAVNLWNGQSYATVGADATYVPKQIYKGMRNTAADIKKMSQLLGGQCSLGFIYNSKKGVGEEATDDFLSGAAVSAGATLRNIRLGATTASSEWLNLKSPKAIEIGLSSDKADIDAGASISIPLLQTPIKY